MLPWFDLHPMVIVRFSAFLCTNFIIHGVWSKTHDDSWSQCLPARDSFIILASLGFRNLKKRIWISEFSLNYLNRVWNDKFFIDEIYKVIWALLICGFEMIQCKMLFQIHNITNLFVRAQSPKLKQSCIVRFISNNLY